MKIIYSESASKGESFENDQLEAGLLFAEIFASMSWIRGDALLMEASVSTVGDKSL